MASFPGGAGGAAGGGGLWQRVLRDCRQVLERRLLGDVPDVDPQRLPLDDRRVVLAVRAEGVDLGAEIQSFDLPRGLGGSEVEDLAEGVPARVAADDDERTGDDGEQDPHLIPARGERIDLRFELLGLLVLREAGGERIGLDVPVSLPLGVVAHAGQLQCGGVAGQRGRPGVPVEVLLHAGLGLDLNCLSGPLPGPDPARPFRGGVIGGDLGLGASGRHRARRRSHAGRRSDARRRRGRSGPHGRDVCPGERTGGDGRASRDC
ncbi:hypothetical protein VT03_14175 [Planctomyces sp. SH-PL14]|nr:hypothetical protein VT03_14175 [Planctomyces sp. SH-PL14]